MNNFENLKDFYYVNTLLFCLRRDLTRLYFGGDGPFIDSVDDLLASVRSYINRLDEVVAHLQVVADRLFNENLDYLKQGLPASVRNDSLWEQWKSALNSK